MTLLHSKEVASNVLTDDLSFAESMNSYFSSEFTSKSFTSFLVFNKVVDSSDRPLFATKLKFHIF